jgi:hypothetical protein
MKLRCLLLLLLAGCTYTGDVTPEPSAERFKERHPEWPIEDCQRLADGTIWIGMSEKQFLYLMRRRTNSTEWQVTQSPGSRIYQRGGSRETYVIDLSTGKLADWMVVGQ